MENIFRIPKLALLLSLLGLGGAAVSSLCLGAAEIPMLKIFEFVVESFFGNEEGLSLIHI